MLRAALFLFIYLLYLLLYELNTFFKDHEKELTKLLGDVKLVVSERRHANTAGLLFKKNGFSQLTMPVKSNQKCSSNRCLTSKGLPNLPKNSCFYGRFDKVPDPTPDPNHNPNLYPNPKLNPNPYSNPN